MVTMNNSESASETAKEVSKEFGNIHLKRINSINDDRCWWCNSGDRQTVKHLFKLCTK
jgi:hypothetical protein